MIAGLRACYGGAWIYLKAEHERGLEVAPRWVMYVIYITQLPFLLMAVPVVPFRYLFDCLGERRWLSAEEYGDLLVNLHPEGGSQ